jgi:predicted nucleic acid-binding protein
MSGSNLFADTNFFVYLLKGHRSVRPYLNRNFFISEITEMELLGENGISPIALKAKTEIIENCFLVNFNSDIKKIAIRIKQNTPLKLPDAIIAASAIYTRIPLITADKEFLKVSELDVELLKV